MARKTKTKPNENRTTSTTPDRVTAYERTRARQTGVSIEQLRAEQEAAERMMKLKLGREPKAD